MRKPGRSIAPLFKPFAFALVFALAAPVFSPSLRAAVAPVDSHTAAPKPKHSKYPLRVHILASDNISRTQRMGPAESVACDSIDGMTDSISPNPGGPISLSGLSGDPCGIHAGLVMGRLLDLQTDYVYSGEGRADLVSPPSGTQGFTFHYDDCIRVRVFPGFQSLPARWKGKPGKRLEVLIPSDEIPDNRHPLEPIRCTLDVTLEDTVYLLLRNGAIVQVAQQDYWKHPALHILLSGRTPTAEQRAKTFTVPAHPETK